MKKWRIWYHFLRSNEIMQGHFFNPVFSERSRRTSDKDSVNNKIPPTDSVSFLFLLCFLNEESFQDISQISLQQKQTKKKKKFFSFRELCSCRDEVCPLGGAAVRRSNLSEPVEQVSDGHDQHRTEPPSFTLYRSSR